MFSKGDIVCFKSGMDEWTVDYGCVNWIDLKRDDVLLLGVAASKLALVKKFEPPKPDYYVNCKGAEPKHGDVFVSDSETVFVGNDRYTYLGTGSSYSLASAPSHRIGNTSNKRTLVARDAKPYVGTSD